MVDTMKALLGLLLMLVSCHTAEIEAQKVVYAQIGSSVTIPRISWGTQDKVHVNWYFDKTILIKRNPTSFSSKPEAGNWEGRVSLTPDFSLIISNVLESDFGIFKCQQYELMETDEKNYKLYKVSVTMLTPGPLLAGSTLSLQCEPERPEFSSAQPTIRWLGPDNKINPGILQSNNRILKVNNVSGVHTGKWICEITSFSTSNAMTDVVIVDLAPSPSDPIYTSEYSSDFPIPCSLSSNVHWSAVNATDVEGGSWKFTQLDQSQANLLLQLQPSPNPAWKHPSNGSRKSLKETEVKNQDLHAKISQVSVDDRGTYTCSLEFKLKTISRRVNVEVLQVISSAGSIVIFEGSSVNLTCTLGHSLSPDLEVKWIPPKGSSLKNLIFPHPMILSIPQISLMDRGRWTCQLIKNATMLTSAAISLKIVKAPVNIWIIVGVVGGVLVFLLFALITVVIFRRRKEVMRYRRRKRRVCCCKNNYDGLPEPAVEFHPKPKGFYKT